MPLQTTLYITGPHIAAKITEVTDEDKAGRSYVVRYPYGNSESSLEKIKSYCLQIPLPQTDVTFDDFIKAFSYRKYYLPEALIEMRLVAGNPKAYCQMKGLNEEEFLQETWPRMKYEYKGHFQQKNKSESCGRAVWQALGAAGYDKFKKTPSSPNHLNSTRIGMMACDLIKEQEHRSVLSYRLALWGLIPHTVRLLSKQIFKLLTVMSLAVLCVGGFAALLSLVGVGALSALSGVYALITLSPFLFVPVLGIGTHLFLKYGAPQFVSLADQRILNPALRSSITASLFAAAGATISVSALAYAAVTLSLLSASILGVLLALPVFAAAATSGALLGVTTFCIGASLLGVSRMLLGRLTGHSYQTALTETVVGSLLYKNEPAPEGYANSIGELLVRANNIAADMSPQPTI